MKKIILVLGEGALIAACNSSANQEEKTGTVTEGTQITPAEPASNALTLLIEPQRREGYRPQRRRDAEYL